MNEKLRKSYLDHFGHKEHTFEESQTSKDMAVKTSEKDSLLTAIYAINPRTGLPSGDIACYVSSNTSPEVKKFILDNIMMDTSSAALPSIPDGIDENTAFELSRQQGESLDSYCERLDAYTQKQLELRDTLVANAKEPKE